MSRAQLDAAQARKFILAGSATVTLESAKTGARFTYKVRASDDGRLHFVSLLNGADNESDFAYMGLIRGDGYTPGKADKTRISADAPSARAFAWAWSAIAAGRIPADLNVWHEGRCGRCNRKLTVPESIASGFGPECAGK